VLRRLAPLAARIGGSFAGGSTSLHGTYRDHRLRISYSPKQPLGSGESATYFNAFHIQVIDLPGRSPWRIPFELTGVLGQGPKRLYIEAQDEALKERLRQSGILREVAEVSAPTTYYVTVDYDPRQKTLTYTDDVSPAVVPSLHDFQKQLDLVARLVEIHQSVNRET